jgi:hypothetical protein
LSARDVRVSQDTWTDSAKDKAIKKQKTGAALKARKGNAMHVVKFLDFVEAYGLTEMVESSVFCAAYTGSKSKKLAPGRGRAKSTIAGLTYQHCGFEPDGKLGPPVRGQYHALFQPLDQPCSPSAFLSLDVD